jgi:hypothetical protein
MSVNLDVSRMGKWSCWSRSKAVSSDGWYVLFSDDDHGEDIGGVKEWPKSAHIAECMSAAAKWET